MKKTILFTFVILNAGAQTRIDWVSQVRNTPGLDARSYSFVKQTPGITLYAGNNTITLSPVPQGINGTDIGHSVYVSGGTGTPGTCLIVGGNAVSGAASGQIAINCAGGHSGAWSISSATGGLQEAICALPASGGEVVAPTNIILYASVTTCGKTSVIVNQQSGSTITGSFTILDGIPLNTGQQNFQNTNNSLFIQNGFSNLNANWEGRLILLNTSDSSSLIWGNGLSQAPSALSAVADYSKNTALAGGTAMALEGAVSGSPNIATVGVMGECTAGPGYHTAGCWAANFVVDLYTDQGQAPTNGWGLEIDLNVRKSGSVPDSVYGIATVSSAFANPNGEFIAFDAEKADFTLHPTYPFDIAFRSQEGAAWTGLLLEPNVHPEPNVYTFNTLPAPIAGNNTVYRCTNCTQTNPTSGGGIGAWVNSVTGQWWGGPQFGHIPNGYSQEIEFHGIDPTNGNLGYSYIHTDTGGNLILTSMGEGSPIGGLIQFQVPDFTATVTISNTGLQMAANMNISIPNIKSISGQKYVCITTTGQLVSSQTACSGF